MNAQQIVQSEAAAQRTPGRPDVGSASRAASAAGSGAARDSHRLEATSGLAPRTVQPRAHATGRQAAKFLGLRAHSLLIAMATFAVFFVGWDEIERRIVPDMSTAMRHFLLTVRAAVATIVASTAVYLLMRRQQRSLSETAERIARLLESYKGDPAEQLRFENPHLARGRELLRREKVECPVYQIASERCWQMTACGDGTGVADIHLQQCHDCLVYKVCCPDKLTQLGESFNTLMFMLETQTARVDCMRKQMVEKQKMAAIGQIAAGIAHEVGNPLSSISSVAQLLKRRQADPHVSQKLDLIEAHIKRISNIVRQLVGLARPGPEYWEKGDVNQPLRDAVQLVTYDKRARDIDIEFEPADTLPRTYALMGQLQQVFINLGLNALDALPDGGKLRIRSAHLHDAIVFTFEDTGRGIEPELRQQVFEPFFTTKAPGQGTGLGLAVSRSIVRKHGGTIACHSAVGEGARFIVHLPVLTISPDTNNE